MPHTAVSIDGTHFRINGRLTYEGVTHYGYPIEGLLFNSRMVQAIFDDACPATRARWAYPDTGVWDTERNTDEFCAALPVYREHGLLAVTVGLQGGGSVYTPDVYDAYENSAFAPDGTFRAPYFARLRRVLAAADAVGMVVIVNFFYWKHAAHISEDRTLYDITERATAWLLETGYENILVDVANEANPWWKRDAFDPANVHRFIEIVQVTTRHGRRLLAAVSTGGGMELPAPRWLAAEDFSLPHGNGLTPDELREKLRRLKDTPEYRTRPRPLLVNEDSIFVSNLEAALAEGASWGYYDQGYGSGYRDRMDWTGHGREAAYAELSGFQTVPVNWGINTPHKRAFFAALKAITSGVTP